MTRSASASMKGCSLGSCGSSDGVSRGWPPEAKPGCTPSTPSRTLLASDAAGSDPCPIGLRAERTASLEHAPPGLFARTTTTNDSRWWIRVAASGLQNGEAGVRGPHLERATDRLQACAGIVNSAGHESHTAMRLPMHITGCRSGWQWLVGLGSMCCG